MKKSLEKVESKDIVKKMLMTDLDLIIEDYMKLDKLITRLKELEIENQNLKIKIEALKKYKS